MACRLMVVDDHKYIRDYVRLLCEIAGDGQFSVVAEAGNVQEALHRWREADPDIVLLDIFLPDGLGFTIAEQMRSWRPETKIVFCTCADDTAFIQEALRIGVVGFLPKSTKLDLWESLRRIAGGQRVYPDNLPAARPTSGGGMLSVEEIQALSLKARGGTTPAIAKSLRRSRRATERLLTSACRKLGAANATHAVHILTNLGRLGRS